MNQTLNHKTSRRGFLEALARGAAAAGLLGLVAMLGRRRPAGCKTTSLCERCPALARCPDPAAKRTRR